MNFLSELKHLADSFLSWLFSWVLLAVFFFSFGLQKVTVSGWDFLLPIPSTAHSLAALVFEVVQKNLVPEGVTLIVTNPLTAFFAEAEIAFFLGLLSSFPFLLDKIVAYLAPALFAHERRKVLTVVFASAGLFAAGCFFAYVFVIPAMLDVLYPYASALGATAFLDVGELISLVFGLMFVTGILFLLPVCMVLLSQFGLIPAGFWGRKWGYALLVFLVLSAIITPDGSGVGMAFLTVPLVALYSIGTIISNKSGIMNKEWSNFPNF